MKVRRVTYEEAVGLLPEGETVHTFLNEPFGLIGADWPREETREVIEMIRDSVANTNPEFIDEMAPMCIREGECHEMYPCGDCG